VGNVVEAHVDLSVEQRCDGVAEFVVDIAAGGCEVLGEVGGAWGGLADIDLIETAPEAGQVV
jgi:hypothetical protein